MSDKKDLYVMYCQVASSLYSFAQSEELRSKKQVVWSITTYYYSIVYAARFLCYLHFQKYPTGHAELRDLFSGSNLTNKKSWSLNGTSNVSYDYSSLKDTLVNTYGIEESKILKIGKYLKSLSSIRNDGNYETFIIANQVNHSYLQPLMDRALQINKYYATLSPLILRCLQQYCSNKGNGFIEFINDTNTSKEWAFKDLIRQLEDQKFSTPTIRIIKNQIKLEIYDKSDNLSCLDNQFYNEINFDSFMEKQQIMRDFQTHLDELQNIEVSQ